MRRRRKPKKKKNGRSACEKKIGKVKRNLSTSVRAKRFSLQAGVGKKNMEKPKREM